MVQKSPKPARHLSFNLPKTDSAVFENQHQIQATSRNNNNRNRIFSSQSNPQAHINAHASMAGTTTPQKIGLNFDSRNNSKKMANGISLDAGTAGGKQQLLPRRSLRSRGVDRTKIHNMTLLGSGVKKCECLFVPIVRNSK